MTDHNLYVEIHDFWVRFWREMDAANYPAILLRLSEDCVWLRERECRGHAEILRSLRARPATLFCRHLVTNLTVDEAGVGWRCLFELLSFGHLAASGDDRPPYSTTGPRLISYDASLVRSTEGLRLSSLMMDFLFERTPLAT